MDKKEEIIDLKGKNKNDILEVYKKIAQDSKIQNELYDTVKNEQLADKLYDLYKQRKKTK